jgi:ubiquitin-like-conjugating enzyme ATG10
MTSEDFDAQAIALSEALKYMDDLEDRTLMQWRQEPIESTNRVYLVHPVVLRKTVALPTDITGVAQEDPIEEDTRLFEDEATESSFADSPTFEWRYSIAFSDTWRVPVLHFTVQDSNGNPCPRDLVLSMLPASSTQEDTWDFVSYDEHPITGTPSYFLHPCQTNDILSLMHNDGKTHSSTRLLSWLSLILPAVGHTFPSKVFRELHQRFAGLDLQL